MEKHFKAEKSLESEVLEYVENNLVYDPETGAFYRLKGQSKVGTKNERGYLRLRINKFKRRFYLHRIAWLIFYRRFPVGMLDHINGDTRDNRICNLRECTAQENQFNSSIRSSNKTGFKGVYEKNGSFVARIRINGKKKQIGTFSTKEQAGAAYKQKAAEVHGDFYRKS